MIASNFSYVTYFNGDGLANRLRLHCLAYAYALNTKRKLIVNWKRNNNCYATYHDLFVGGPCSYELLGLGERLFFRSVKRFDCYSFEEGRLTNGENVESLINPPHRVVSVSNLEASTGGGSRLGSYHQEVLKSLLPRPEIEERVSQFMAQFKSPTVGIHVRQGDFINKYNTALPPVKRYVAIVRLLAQLWPSAVFILVSDGNEEVLMPLLDTGKCKIREKVNERHTLEGVQDALIDLLILARTNLVISTPYSSFGGFAAMLGNKPIVRAQEDWETQLVEAINQKLTFCDRPR
ncbi:hypothetical protein [Gloeocapsopsis sp. IPPAS B-1203]|uniref:hypothetical protein n=1 Tax=Gloeocapsopsis sp. IPPAS B-1203 TaxID=2049454 RepID=UPI001180225D|nr:hypothetical protein [Gloeocapsopsis sp. IPPAS B-1203]